MNRVWSHHFGEGIVRTAGDFGVRTEEPVHRALLDFLAATFMKKGWSIKELQGIVLSARTRKVVMPRPALSKPIQIIVS